MSLHMKLKETQRLKTNRWLPTGEGQGGVNEDSGISRHPQPHTKQTNHKGLRYRQDSTRYLVMDSNICVYIYLNHCAVHLKLYYELMTLSKINKEIFF